MNRFASFLYEMAAGPIQTRELRATFRGWRFVMFFTGALALALFILWTSAFSMEQEGAPGNSIGQATFGILIAIQASLIALLVPGFAGTSIVREKDKSTLELLMTTTIRPWQIVWGQLMAALGYVAVYLFAGLPLIAPFNHMPPVPSMKYFSGAAMFPKRVGLPSASPLHCSRSLCST